MALYVLETNFKNALFKKQQPDNSSVPSIVVRDCHVDN